MNWHSGQQLAPEGVRARTGVFGFSIILDEQACGFLTQPLCVTSCAHAHVEG